MTDRLGAKKKRSEDLKAPRKSAGQGTEVSGHSELDRLRTELEAARARIAELEQKHAEVINRIDWVIDSLHNLTE